MHDTSSYKCREHRQKTSHHTQPLALVYRGYSQKSSYTIPSAITSVHSSSTFKTVFSLCCFLGGAPLYCANMPPYQCFRGCGTPMRVMACKANLRRFNNYNYITKQLYTCKYTATDCAIVTFAENRGRIRD